MDVYTFIMVDFMVLVFDFWDYFFNTSVSLVQVLGSSLKHKSLQILLTRVFFM